MITAREAGQHSLDDATLTAVYAVADRATQHVRVNFVSSLDGAVAVDGVSGGLGGADDKRVFGLLRMIADVVLVGAGTVRAENYNGLKVSDVRREWRRAAGLPDHPRLAIVTGRLDLDPGLRALTEAPVRPLVLTRTGAPAAARARLAEVADVVDCGTETVDPHAIVAHLTGLGLPQVLCEGGPGLFGSLSGADLVDELCLSLSPLLAGPGAGRIIAGDEPAVRRMRLASTLSADDGTLLLRYLRADPA